MCETLKNLKIGDRVLVSGRVLGRYRTDLENTPATIIKIIGGRRIPEIIYRLDTPLPSITGDGTFQTDHSVRCSSGRQYPPTITFTLVNDLNESDEFDWIRDTSDHEPKSLMYYFDSGIKPEEMIGMQVTLSEDSEFFDDEYDNPNSTDTLGYITRTYGNDDLLPLEVVWEPDENYSHHYSNSYHYHDLIVVDDKGVFGV